MAIRMSHFRFESEQALATSKFYFSKCFTLEQHLNALMDFDVSNGIRCDYVRKEHVYVKIIDYLGPIGRNPRYSYSRENSLRGLFERMVEI